MVLFQNAGIFKKSSPILQCAYLLLTDSSKGGNALTTWAAGAFSRDFVVRMMTGQNSRNSPQKSINQ